MKIALLTLAPVFIAALALFPNKSQESTERQAIERAALDYLEAIYEGRPELIERSVHPQVVKIGYGRADEGDFPIRPMDFARLLDLAENWSKDEDLPDDVTKEAVLLDHFHDIATVRVTAVWGVDYMLLARSAGRWKIVQVLYQSNPKD